jgi:hypothetical protein
MISILIVLENQINKKRDSNPYKSSDFNQLEQKMGNYHKVDKGELFIKEGMTLITEVESEKYLKMAEKRRQIKEKEDLYPIPDDRLERPCGGSHGFDDFVERWN